MFRRTILLALAVCKLACGPDFGPSTPLAPAPDSGVTNHTSDAGTTEQGLTYYKDAKPILDARCGVCHSPGGIGPFALQNYRDVEMVLPLIQPAIESGRMPPWHASASCGEYQNDRSLTAAEKTLLLEWIATGAQEGHASDEPGPLPVRDPGLSRVDRRLPVQGAFTPTRLDEYRCFVVEWPENEAMYVTGYDLNPSNPALVHHANIFQLPPSQADRYRDLEAQDATPGYRCGSGNAATEGTLLGSWAPGSFGVDFPAGAGLLVEPGSVVVMEIHFNTASAQGEDRSELWVSVDHEVEKRGYILAFYNFFGWPPDGGMSIPRDQADVMHSFQIDPLTLRNLNAPWLPNEAQIIATGAHMHQLGKSATVQIKRAGGSSDCLVTIDDWAFEWQSSYLLKTPKPFDFGADQLYVECHWDNTAEAQPMINGVRQEPRDVEWGSGSADEMCIGYVLLTER